MDSVKTRLIEYIEYKQISKRQFCRTIGVSSTFLANDSEIGSNKVINIISSYPDLSLDWLLTGKGEMLKTKIYSFPEESSSILKEPDQPYITTKDSNLVTQLMQSNTMLVESNQILVENNRILVEANSQLNTQLMELLLQQEKSRQNISNVS